LRGYCLGGVKRLYSYLSADARGVGCVLRAEDRIGLGSKREGFISTHGGVAVAGVALAYGGVSVRPLVPLGGRTRTTGGLSAGRRTEAASRRDGADIYPARVDCGVGRP